MKLLNKFGIGLALIGAAVAINSVAETKMATPPVAAKSESTARAIFAGGCFWCMEAPFDVLPGVISTTSGYISGQKKDPTYQEVSAGTTGHTEAVEIVYDPKKISFDKLLETFWVNIDPTTANKQFCDSGSQYRSGIYYVDAGQEKAARDSKATLDKTKPFKEAIQTEIVAATVFYAAEDYHQDYYKKNPIRYKYYRNGCGRDARLKQIWGDKARGAAH